MNLYEILPWECFDTFLQPSINLDITKKIKLDKLQTEKMSKIIRIDVYKKIHNKI